MKTKLYTTKQAAAEVGITRQSLYNWIDEKKIQPPKAVTLGNRTMMMWSESDLRKLRRAKDRIYRKGRGRKRVKASG
jgi:predicted DNA-binding transcriptional regulator AlpA